MAYLRHIQSDCCKCRARIAVYELLSNSNAPHGSFCSPCAKQALANLERDEKAYRDKIERA